MNQWTPTGQHGLRYREHETRTKGIGRYERPLRYYVAVYKWKKKTVTDVYGWEGDDFKNEDDIVAAALDLRKNRRDMQPPFTLKERHDLRKHALAEIEIAEQEKRTRQEIQEKTVLKALYQKYCEIHSDKKSLKNERSLYEKWINPAIGEKQLDEIVLLDLERIRKRMEKAEKAPRTIQYVKSIVRQIYTFATAHSLYSGDVPTRLFLKNKKFDNARKRYLTPAEARLLLNELQKHSVTLYRMALLSLNTAMRFGEIASLRWQHINLENREILVVDPKNSETRSVFMTGEVERLFRSMAKGAPNDLVLPSRHKRNSEGDALPRVQDSVSNVFDRVVKDLGLNDGVTDRCMRVVFHSLRHTAASWLVNSGVGLPVIGKVLGHKSLKMTERYSHVNDNSVRNAMELLDQKQNEHERQPVLKIQSG